MALIAEDETYTQVVRFDVTPDKQMALIGAIVGEVERWVQLRPGFISSTLHASHDGSHVINYAQWTNEAAFKGFLEDRENRKLQEAIHEVDASLKPNAVHCRVVRAISR